MTVCIAAACDGGRKVVTATDGLLSTGDAVADTLIGKMIWLGEWQFMYAGNPANFALINEEIKRMADDDPQVLLPQRIQKTVRTAYRRFVAHYGSFDILNSVDMTLEDFKRNGQSFFGEAFHSDMLRQITEKCRLVEDEIVVTGWTGTPISAMLYEIGPHGHALHDAACFATIGSGRNMAQTMLMLLGQRRESTLAETLFNVACAKFSSEASVGVGRNTGMHISWQRTPEDPPQRVAGKFIQDDDIQAFRDLWERYLKPRIPDEARGPINKIAARLNDGKGAFRDMCEQLSAVERIQAARLKIYEEVKAAMPPDPQSTTTDPSPQPPLPESPGGTGES